MRLEGNPAGLGKSTVTVPFGLNLNKAAGKFLLVFL